jgi:hypothetical protein
MQLSFLLFKLPLVILVMWITISFIWVSLGCIWLLLVLFGLMVVAILNVLAGVEPTHNRTPSPSKNIQGSHNQQTKQNQKQPHAKTALQ